MKIIVMLVLVLSLSSCVVCTLTVRYGNGMVFVATLKAFE